MAHDSETRDIGQLQQVGELPGNFTIDEVNHLWDEIPLGDGGSTITLEKAPAPRNTFKNLQVPRRSIGKLKENETYELPTSIETIYNSSQIISSCDRAYHAYSTGGTLGEGGMGIIYEATQSALNRPVAIKMLKKDACSEAQRAKFLSEAVLTGSLEHPNIIALHDLGVDQDNNLFYAMKKINGQSWSESINDLSLDENLEIFLRVCNAVAFAHSRNVVHRDIKPGNVMLGEFGEVLLMDWGLAVVLPPNRPLKSTEFPALGGTPSYMAPELARGDFKKLGRPSDVYLLGAVLFQIVTKSPPHEGETIPKILLNAANNVIRPTTKVGELLSIATKAMATDPDQRFKTATELRSTIRRFQTHSQSMGLTRRAKKMAKRAKQRRDYAMFANAILTFEEALEIWPENRKATNGLLLTKKYYTEAAIENGDLDLAASILECTENVNDTAKKQSKTLSARVSKLKEDRDTKEEKQQQTEQDLHKWTTAFEASPDLVAISRLRDGLIFEVNQAFLDKLDYSRDEVIGKNALQLKMWVNPEQRQEFIAEIESTGRCDEMEAVIRTKSGNELPVLMSACKLGFEGETAVITNAHDISSRKAMEKALAESEQRLRETQELAKLGTWEFNLETEEITWSDETFRIIGLSKASGEPSLEGFISTVHPDDVEILLRLINKARDEGSPYRVEIRHRQADGRYKHVLATGKPKFENDRVVLLFGSVMDISEFHRNPE